MRILYVPIGSFCHPKIIIRDTNRDILESLPFDFHSTPHLSSISRVFKELYETNEYQIEYKNILYEHKDEQLVVSDKNDMYIVHYFYKNDLIDSTTEYPCSTENIKEEKKIEVKEKLEKRFLRLLHYINKKDDIICFLRIENYENWNWDYEVQELTSILSNFKNNNKYLIYTQALLDENVDYRKTNQISYKYSIPVIFYKELYDDNVLVCKKELFTNILEDFENLLNNHSNIIEIENQNGIEKYYLDFEKKTIFKLTDLNLFSTFHIENDILYINTAIYGYEKYYYHLENKRYVFFT